MRQTIQTSLFCVACFTEKLSSRLQSFANKFACSYDMNLCHGTVVLSQCLVELTQHARLNTLDMGALCSFAVYGCTGLKIEVQETVNKNFNIFQANFCAPITVVPMAPPIPKKRHCQQLKTYKLYPTTKNLKSFCPSENSSSCGLAQNDRCDAINEPNF